MDIVIDLQLRPGERLRLQWPLDLAVTRQWLEPPDHSLDLSVGNTKMKPLDTAVFKIPWPQSKSQG